MEPIESFPDPRIIFEAADAESPKFNLRVYHAGMANLRAKGYSFGDIAKWMSEQLGVKVTRSQVAYVLTAPAGALEADEQDECDEDEADQIAEQNELGAAVTEINGRKVAE